MSEHITPEEAIAAARSKMCMLAREILDEQIPVLDGAYEMYALLSQSGLPIDDPIYQDFLLIESENETLPIGPQKHLWAPVALARLQPELETAGTMAKPIAFGACQSILQRFSF